MIIRESGPQFQITVRMLELVGSNERSFRLIYGQVVIAKSYKDVSVLG